MVSHATGDGGIPTREATKHGLKRIMTIGGAYGTRNYTVKSLRDQKGKRVLVETLPFSPEEAAAAEEAGIDTMKVRFDPSHTDRAAAIRAAAPGGHCSYRSFRDCADKVRSAAKPALESRARRR